MLLLVRWAATAFQYPQNLHQLFTQRCSRGLAEELASLLLTSSDFSLELIKQSQTESRLQGEALQMASTWSTIFACQISLTRAFLNKGPEEKPQWIWILATRYDRHYHHHRALWATDTHKRTRLLCDDGPLMRVSLPSFITCCLSVAVEASCMLMTCSAGTLLSSGSPRCAQRAAAALACANLHPLGICSHVHTLFVR